MIGLIGVDYNTTPLDIREKFSLCNDDIITLVTKWKDLSVVDGAIAISTCNRVEIYYSISDDEYNSNISLRLKNSIFETLSLTQEYGKFFVEKINEDAVQHLFALSSGLKSMVVGETQILGQIKDAFRLSTTHNLSTAILSRLFHKAFQTAKIIRSSCLIKATSFSAGASAVDLSLKNDKDYNNKRILIIGAGQMADTIYSRLKYHNVDNIYVYNRTKERADKFAELHQDVKIFSQDELKYAISISDIIYVATSALNPIVTTDILDEKREPFTLFDLSVPRNVSSEVDLLPLSTVYTIDDLHKNKEADTIDNNDIDQANNVVSEMTQEFMSWIDAGKIRSVIANIQTASDIILNKELERLPNSMTKYDKEIIEEWDKHFRITYSTAIISALRDITNDGQNTQYTQAINALFCKIIDN